MSTSPGNGSDDPRRCPFCQSTSVRMISSFGSCQLTRQAYCEDCNSVFEQVRDRSPAGSDSDRPGQGSSTDGPE